MEAEQQKLQRAVDQVVEGIEKSHLRPARKTAFLQMAKCCDSASSSREAYHSCVQRAAAPEERSNGVVQQELNEFQNRLQRAVMACQDQVKDSGVTDPDLARTNMDACLLDVFQRHVKLVPTLKKRILQTI